MNRILLGTTKGLCVLKKSGRGFELDEVHFKGLPVSMLHYQEKTNSLWVGLSMKHWGPKLFFRRGDGDWEELPSPGYPGDVELRPGKKATLQLIWSALYHEEQETLWLGTEPGGLFSLRKGDREFTLNRSLWNHPDRLDHWFGGGRNDAGIHTILKHPEDALFLMVGVSCGGVYVTGDAGENWKAQNQGLKAEYLPDPYGPYGHDPHAMFICRSAPATIWQQNHCGVFLSRDTGRSWLEVTPPNGYGKYGFALAGDDLDPDQAWIIPVESDDQRVAKDLRLVVNHTQDGGKTWNLLTEGLPSKNCFDLVFRHALARKEGMMVFGTTTGHVFTSEDNGNNWKLSTDFLPPVHSVVIL